MPCFFPLKGFRAVGGGVVFDGSRGGLPVKLPCGQCRGCRAERARQWSLRCVHEAQISECRYGCCGKQLGVHNSFVTLTYDAEHLPSDGGLRVEDFQKFCKRLRKSCGPFRFFHCGEYGEANKRPHYHACLFGLDFNADRVLLRGSGQNRLYFSGLLTRTWGLGHCSIGSLTIESAAYVARYCMKKLTGAAGDAEYSRVDAVTGEVFRVRPPYVTMSRRPGIASEWFDRFSADVYPSDEVVHAGRRFRPPRFYDSKLPEGELEVLKRKRFQRAASRKEDLTDERLKVRAECADARLSSLRRSL